MSKQFVDSLKKLEQEFQQQPLSPERDQAIRAKLQGEQTPLTVPRLSMSWAVAFALLCVASGALLYPFSQQQNKVGGFVLLEGTAQLTQNAVVGCQSKQCKLDYTQRRTKFNISQATQIKRVQHNLALMQGQAFFNVEPRRPKEQPLRIFVSHGYIEVIGTQFTLWQGHQKGRLHLHEGVVRYVQKDGQTRVVREGGKLAWPLLKPAKKASKKTQRAKPIAITNRAKPKRRRTTRSQRKVVMPIRRAQPTQRVPRRKLRSRTKQPFFQPKKPKQQVIREVQPEPKVMIPGSSQASPPPVRLDKESHQIIRQVAQLRLRQKYKQAVQLLRKHISRLSPTQQDIRELLHFEIGQFLANYLKQNKQACKHWRTHQRLFRRSRRYHQEIAFFLKQLSCP